MSCRPRPSARRIAAALCALGWAVLATGTSPVRADVLPEPLDRPALMTPRASSAVLLGLARAGTRMLAVGERGIVLVSNDEGGSWQQVAVPTSVTLTAASFVTPDDGWAIGHSGIVLATADGGRTWTRRLDGKRAARIAMEAAQAAHGDDKRAADVSRVAQRLVDDGADKPFLDLHFVDARHGIVIGAYGLIFGTDDGGRTWTSWLDRLENPKGLHLNALAVSGESIVIAGEQGLLLRSGDGGKSFARLGSPYEGSWFAASYLPGGRLLVAGLRGNVFFSDDAGASFTRAEMTLRDTVGSLCVLADGSVLALNQGGQVQVSRDQGRSFHPLAMPAGPLPIRLAQSSSGRVLASSVRGVQVLPIGLPSRSPQ